MTETSTTKERDKDDFKLLDTLLEAEKRVDSLIMTKRLEMQEWLTFPSRVRCKIRVSVSTQFAIPAQFSRPTFTLPATRPLLSETKNLAGVELKLEGKIVEAFLLPDTLGLSSASSLPLTDSSKYNKNFSTFFKSILVEFDPKAYGSDLRSLEWVRSLKSVENDGFIIRRPVVTVDNFDVSFIFSLNCNPPQFKLSETLSPLLGGGSQTKAHTISLLWRYITANNLLDTYRPELIHCNDVLKNAFGVEQFILGDIPSLLLPHLLPLNPQSFTLRVENPLAKVSTSPGIYASNSQTFDLIAEVSDFFKDLSQPFVVEYDNKTISMDVNELQTLDQRAKKITDEIIQTKSRIRDYRRFIHNPSAFISHWLNAQCKKVSSQPTLTVDSRTVIPDDDRSSEFFSKPWIQEYVQRYIFNLIENKSNELKKMLT